MRYEIENRRPWLGGVTYEVRQPTTDDGDLLFQVYGYYSNEHSFEYECGEWEASCLPGRYFATREAAITAALEISC